MDIHNIPIAKITGQYLEYLHKLEHSTWTSPPTSFTWPRRSSTSNRKCCCRPIRSPARRETEDPRADLVHRLVEHEKFKNAAQLLHQSQQIEEHVWSKPDLSLYNDEETEGELVVSLVDLVNVFQQVLERRKEVVRIELHHEQFTVAQMMELLRQQLLASEDSASNLDAILRVLPVAPCHDRRFAGGPRNGHAPSSRHGAGETVRRHPAQESIKCSTRFSPKGRTETNRPGVSVERRPLRCHPERSEGSGQPMYGSRRREISARAACNFGKRRLWL